MGLNRNGVRLAIGVIQLRKRVGSRWNAPTLISLAAMSPLTHSPLTSCGITAP
jgi:hypothetical protein